MLKKSLHFLKYNNAALLILVIIFIMGSGVWAQTDAGQEFIGEKQVHVENVDNSLLLDLDLGNFDMDFKIENIESDDKYYYVTYTYLDLEKEDDAWEYLLSEKTRKVSKKLKKDLGLFLGEELKEEQDARIALLQREQEKAMEDGIQLRSQVEEYSGLIGKTLAIGEKVFKNYEAVKVRTIPSPSIPPTILAVRQKDEGDGDLEDNEGPDSLTDVYAEALERLDSDDDGYFRLEDNCPNIYNPDQADSDKNGIGDLCEPSDAEAMEDGGDDGEVVDDDEVLSDDEEILDDESSDAEAMEDGEDDEVVVDDESSDAEAMEDGEDGEVVVDDEAVMEENDEEFIGEEDPVIEEETEDEPELKTEPTPEPEPDLAPALEEPDVEIIELPNN